MAPDMSSSDRGRSPNNSALIDWSPTDVQRAWSAGYSPASRCCTTRMAATARAESTPARNRTSVRLSTCSPRRVRTSGWAASKAVIGSHSCTGAQ